MCTFGERDADLLRGSVVRGGQSGDKGHQQRAVREEQQRTDRSAEVQFAAADETAQVAERLNYLLRQLRYRTCSRHITLRTVSGVAGAGTYPGEQGRSFDA